MAERNERGSDFTKKFIARDERLRGFFAKCADAEALGSREFRILFLLMLDGPVRRYNKGEAEYQRRQFAEWLGITENSVSKGLARLEHEGLIERESHRGPGGSVTIRVLLPVAGDASVPNVWPFQPWLKDTPIGAAQGTNRPNGGANSAAQGTNEGPDGAAQGTNIGALSGTHIRGEIPSSSGERNTLMGGGAHDALDESPAAAGSGPTPTGSAHHDGLTNDDPVVASDGIDEDAGGSSYDEEAETDAGWDEPGPVVRVPGDATAEQAVEIFAGTLGKPLSAATRKRLVASLGEVQPSTTLLEMLMGLGFWHEYRDGRFPQDAAERVEQAMALDSGDIDLVNCLTTLGAVKEGRDRAQWQRMSPAERKDFVLSPAFWATGPSSDGPGSEIVNVRGTRRNPIFSLDDAFGVPLRQFHAAWTGRSEREPVVVNAEIVSPAPF